MYIVLRCFIFCFGMHRDAPALLVNAPSINKQTNEQTKQAVLDDDLSLQIKINTTCNEARQNIFQMKKKKQKKTRGKNGHS